MWTSQRYCTATTKQQNQSSLFFYFLYLFIYLFMFMLLMISLLHLVLKQQMRALKFKTKPSSVCACLRIPLDSPRATHYSLVETLTSTSHFINADLGDSMQFCPFSSACISIKHRFEMCPAMQNWWASYSLLGTCQTTLPRSWLVQWAKTHWIVEVLD